MPIDLSSASIINHPFPHFAINNAVSLRHQDEFLTWLERDAPWKLIETDFYEQYEFSLLQPDLPVLTDSFAGPNVVQYLSQCVSSIFNTSLQKRVEITVHKLVQNQTIRIHNDYIPGEETHRVLVQLNRGWNESLGGQLMLFSGPEPEHIYDIIQPCSGSAQGFEISRHSYHAVSTVHGGERFTIVYSFFANAS